MIKETDKPLEINGNAKTMQYERQKKALKKQNEPLNLRKGK